MRAALQNAQFEFPARKITVNLAPADLPKESGRFDLPIAIGILAATGQLPARRARVARICRRARAERRVARDSRRAADGAGGAARRPRVRAAGLERRRGGARSRRARASGRDAAGGVRASCRPRADPALARNRSARADVAACPDLADVRGQVQAKRALTIAAAGAHSLLMIGPPGTGKSMLAQRLPGLLPPLTEDEALEARRSRRSPAASVRPMGTRVRFARRITRRARSRWSAAAAIRAPAKSRSRITACCSSTSCRNGTGACWRCCASRSSPASSTSRARRARATFPARVPVRRRDESVPCGWLGHDSGRCHCTPDRIARYRARISGPLLDRIDIGIEVPALAPDALAMRGPATECADRAGTGGTARAHAARARARQMRQGKPNARLATREIEVHCSPDSAGAALLRAARWRDCRFRRARITGY